MRLVIWKCLKLAYALAFLLVACSLSAIAQDNIGQHSDGELARMITIPGACQTAREFGISGRWKSQLFFQAPIQVGRPPTQTPGPACVAAESCFSAMKTQAAAGVEYLTRNPAVSDALNSRMSPSTSVTRKIQQLLAAESGTSWGPYDRCTLVWTTVDGSWFPLTTDRAIPGRSYPFLEFSNIAHALVEKARTDYTLDENEYQQLLAFNGRYTGLEQLQRAHTTYQQAFKADDLATMINVRSAMLHELEQARTRKQLLTQQSEQLLQNGNTLADFDSAIDREGLTNFVGSQTKTAIGEVRSELGRLAQMAPRDRGDISAKLEIFATRIHDIDSALQSARSIKTQAEQTRRMLVESANAGRRALDTASSEEFKGLFDEEFRNSAGDLINLFSELASNDLGVIQQKKEEIDVAKRKLAVLRDQVSDAEARYDRAKTLDSTRQATLQKISQALSEFGQPELRGKLGSDGIDVISSLTRYRETLTSMDSVRLASRNDYSETLLAAQGALAKTQVFKEEMDEVAQLAHDLQDLNNNIDRRGRRLLDQPTSSAVARVARAVNTLTSANIPLSAEAQILLSNSRAALSRLPDQVGIVTDREEKDNLRNELPSQRGVWRFVFDKDIITDDERVQAFASVDGSQAKYELTIACNKQGGKLVIATFQPLGTDPKPIPWNIYDPKRDKNIRLRIDSSPAFGASLEIRGYVNQGQVIGVDGAQFEKLLLSSRLAFADVFPEEQVEVETAYPPQFGRLCELVAPPFRNRP